MLCPTVYGSLIHDVPLLTDDRHGRKMNAFYLLYNRNMNIPTSFSPDQGER
jgi:hypothetical protein